MAADVSPTVRRMTVGRCLAVICFAGITSHRHPSFPASDSGTDGIPLVAMATSGQKATRRQFVSRSVLLTGGIGLGLNSMTKNVLPESETDNAFSSYQKSRREALWGLLGDLPWQHEPAAPKVVRTEDHDHYTLQRLVLDLNGIEPVPALLLIPKRLQRPAPGLALLQTSV